MSEQQLSNNILHPNQQSNQLLLKQISKQIQFNQYIRSFCIRYVTYFKQKSYPNQQIQQIQQNLIKIIFNQKFTQQIILNKILQIDLKGDYHQVIILTLFQDLIKWAKQHLKPNLILFSQKQLANSQKKLPSLTKIKSNQKISQSKLINQSSDLLSLLIQKTISLLNSQQQFHTIVPKQNDLLHQLLIMPHIIINLQHFRLFYRKLKDIKQFYPSTIKQNQKILFLKTIEEVIQIITKQKDQKMIKTLEFIFMNNFIELQVIEENNQLVPSRLKLIRKIVKNIWFFNDEIMYKSSFLIVKYSQYILNLPHLFSSTINLYEDLMPRLIQKVSPSPLIIFNHLIINNIKKLLEQTLKNKNYFTLQILLNSLSNIFKMPFIQYFMKNYDTNFMQESICQSSLNILFEFIQNRSNQKRLEYQLFKKYLKISINNIRKFLMYQEKNGFNNKLQEKLLKFYEVKKKQYLQIIKDMNQKPKKIFKKLESLTNKEIKEQIIKKYIRIAKKSSHLQIKAMINIFSSNNSVSQQLFNEYVNNLFTNLNKDVSLEQFLRYFSSNFFLNGQSQQILRVLDKITQLYYHHQSEEHKIMKNSDSTYTFANAIILLNSDLHNPQNETKMSLQSFYKMCKKINNGQDLAADLLSKTYFSIKKNKINTFRNKSNIHGISAYNFVLICNCQQENRISYYDAEMKILKDQNFYNSFIYDTLSSIIDERQTNKLQQLIAEYHYNNTTYQCEIIESLRKLSKKKLHIALHGLQKILEYANFKNSKTSQSLIQYFWLATNLIENFHQLLPTNVICQVLIMTWRMRNQLKDDMYLRQRAQIKRIKRLIEQFKKRSQRKTIMDMFSSFLSSKDQQSEDQIGMNEQFIISSNNLKKMNYKVLSQKILSVIMMKSNNIFQQGNIQNNLIQNDRLLINSNNEIKLKNKNNINHRIKSIQFFINYLKNDQQKIFQQFISLLYLIFHLVYKIDQRSSQCSKLIQNKQQGSKQIIQQLSTESNCNKQGKQQSYNKQQINKLIENLSESQSLQSRQYKKQLAYYQLMIQDLFYELLGLKQSQITKRIQNLKKKDPKKYNILSNYSSYWILKIMINTVNNNSLLMKKLNNNKNHKQNNLDYLLDKSLQFLQKTDKQTFLDLFYQLQTKTRLIYNMNDKQIQQHNQQQNQQMIQEFIIQYSKLIQVFYKNGCRIIGQKQFNSIKQYKWLITIYKVSNQIKNKIEQQIKQQKVNVLNAQNVDKQYEISSEKQKEIKQKEQSHKQQQINPIIKQNNQILEYSEQKQSEIIHKDSLQQKIQRQIPTEYIKNQHSQSNQINIQEKLQQKIIQNDKGENCEQNVTQLEQQSLLKNQIIKQPINQFFKNQNNEQNKEQNVLIINQTNKLNQNVYKHQTETIQQKQQKKSSFTQENKQYANQQQQLLGMPIYLL